MNINQAIADVKLTGLLLLVISAIGILGTLLFWENRSSLDSIFRLVLVLGFIYLSYLLLRVVGYLKKTYLPLKRKS